MSGELDRWESLVRKAERGEILPEAAEAEAKVLGLGPLAHKPKESSFDPMSEPWWTLPMAVGWIVWRRPRTVLLCWDKYRLKCWAWRPMLGRHRLVRDRPATLAMLMRAEREAKAHKSGQPGTKVVENVLSVRSAKTALWIALRGGKVQATGIRLGTNQRVLIPDFEWHDLDNIEEMGRDVVCVENAALQPFTEIPARGATAKLVMHGHDASEATGRPRAHGYAGVVVRETEVLAIWRPLKQDASTAEPVQHDRSAELLESLPNLRERMPDLIRLPDDEPRSDQGSAAWSAIKFLWPKGVPSNKSTALVHRLVNKWIKKQPRNITSVESVSRETVDRLLGRRK
jgi:hypothetical protein